MKLHFSDYGGPTGLFVANGKKMLPLNDPAGATAFVGAAMHGNDRPKASGEDSRRSRFCVAGPPIGQAPIELPTAAPALGHGRIRQFRLEIHPSRERWASHRGLGQMSCPETCPQLGKSGARPDSNQLDGIGLN